MIWRFQLWSAFYKAVYLTKPENVMIIWNEKKWNLICWKITNVIFRGREAILTRYFDATCLLFDKGGNKPEWEDIKLIDDYYPEKYFLFFTQISCNERVEIKSPEGKDLFDCYCESFLFTQDLQKTDWRGLYRGYLLKYVRLQSDRIRLYIQQNQCVCTYLV